MVISNNQNEIKDSDKVFKFIESNSKACECCSFNNKNCERVPCCRSERWDSKMGYFVEVEE